MGGSAAKRCGLTEQIIFMLAIASGTACSICSKVMMQMHGEGIGGDSEIFGKPIFQTFERFENFEDLYGDSRVKVADE